MSQNILQPAPEAALREELAHPPKKSSAKRRKRKPRGRARLNYHEIRCAICHHPEREAIEQAFLQWCRPGRLTREFNLGHRTAIYRHAEALGLFQRRARLTQHALGLIIERAETVEATADSIIRAVRAHSHIDENGRWTEPPRRTIIRHERSKPAPLRQSPARNDDKSIATHAGKKPR